MRNLTLSWRSLCGLFTAALLLAFFVGSASGQSLIAGDISGTVLDASQAVVPGAAVTLKNLQTGAVQKTTTSNNGTYRFSLLKPGRYQVSVAQPGFSAVNQEISVQVGQVTTTNFNLKVAKTTETVEVTSAAAVISPDASQSTSYSQIEVQNLPNAGGDITNIADTAPGVVLNSTGGYGNFTVNGMPATSNLFTVNGENDMDPYFNINNSGATNLTLGSNEVQEATVVSNPYSGQYGQLSGAQVTYVTKSGTNNFHGIAQWLWNGRALNANNWISKQAAREGGTTTKTPFSNANQWAAAVGGPIIKNSTFFFADFEGMRFVLPNVFDVTAPTPAFTAAVLANVGSVAPNELTSYQTMMNLYSKVPNYGAGVALPNNDSCNALTLAGFDPTTQSCAQSVSYSGSALAKEWIFAGRIDQRLGNYDNIFFRYKADHGLQPTTIDPVSPNFNALSNQPSWDTQVQETHAFGGRATNAFTAALSHYVAQFQQDRSKVNATFPYEVAFDGTIAPFTTFNFQGSFPQGRNITQYQFIDDYSINVGKHNLKFGGNFRRYDISDHNFFFNNPAVYFGYVSDGLQKFVNGIGFQYRKTANQFSEVPIAMWGLGVYGMDEYKVTNHLTLTFALRAERNSNPVCQVNCFANFKAPWATLASQSAGAGAANVPYTADITFGNHQAYPAVDKIDLSPRFAFSWSPLSNKTVISGGVGIFYDSPPAGLVDDLLGNPPVAAALRVRPAAGTPVFDTGSTGSAAVWQQSASAFQSGFAAGQTYSQIKANLATLGVAFSAPAVTAITGKMHAPRWTEWNFQIQQAVGKNTALILAYVGNHGEQLPYSNAWFNVYDPYGLYPNSLPQSATAPVPNYSNVTYVRSGAISNYEGVTATLKHSFSKWFSGHLNYTWSHNLDEVSNGGIFTYGDSLLGQINPASLRAGNYGNSDYDIRHNLSGDYVFSPTLKRGGFLGSVIGGWQWSGKLFWRTGLPFSIVDGNWNGALPNGGGTILAQPVAGNGGQSSCGERNADIGGNAPPCLDAAAFVDSASPSFLGYNAFSTQRRNQYRGPHFFDMDMALFKTFNLGEKAKFGVGAQAFNVFNHPNFGQPDNNLGSPTFGQISSMVGVPTSPYGNFLGFDSSPRVLQLSAKITF